MPAGRRRLLAYVAVGLVPWSIVHVGDVTTLVCSFGLVDPAGPTVTDVVSYTFAYTRGLPGYLFAWPLGVGLYCLAVASAVLGTVVGREDRRVTAGLLVLVALTQLGFAWGFVTRPGYVAVPTGAVGALLVCWVVEWPAIRGSILPANRYRNGGE